MLYGTGKPQLILKNADGSTSLSRTFPYCNAPVEPEFPEDGIVEWEDGNGKEFKVTRGVKVKIDLYWAKLSDAEYADLITMMKGQRVFSAASNDTTYITIKPRVDDAESYDGYIVTPIKVLNEFWFQTHGARLTFEGRTRLTTFLT